MANGQDTCRHLSAVLLRQCISKHWKRLPAAAQASTKTLLLERLVQEHLRGPRLGIAALISKLAVQTVPSGQWNELMNMLMQCSSSGEAAHREVAMMLFRNLAENITSSLQPHFGELQKLFVRGMEDENERVRLQSIRALSVLVVHLVAGGDDQVVVQSLGPLIPILVRVTQKAVQEGDEDSAAAGFEVFSDLAECSLPILNDFIPALMELMVKTLLTPDMEMSIREKAGLFISDLVVSKPAKIIKFNLVQPIINAAVQLFCEPSELSFVPNEMTPQRLAMEILDATVLNVPVAHTFEQCITSASQLVQDQANPHNLKAGFLILATVAEAHSERLQPQLANLVQLVHNGTTSQNPLVRAAACVALTQFAENMQPGIAKYHDQVLPRLMDMLSNPQEEAQVKRRAVFATECFCEYLGDEIQPYLGDMMARLQAIIVGNFDPEIKVCAINAVTAVATTAGPAFQPYFEGCMNMMGGLMNSVDDQFLDLRAKATECIGAMGGAVGKEAFTPYLNQVLQMSLNGLKLDYPGVREANYRLYSHMARMLQESFAQLFEHVMPAILASVASMESIEEADQNDALNAAGAVAGGAFTGGTDSEDETHEDELRNVRLRIRSGELDEKIEAITALGVIFQSCGASSLSLIEKVLEPVVTNVDFPHEYVRAVTVDTLNEILNLCAREFPRHPWKQGEAVPLHENTAQVMNMILPSLFCCMFMEDDKKTAAAAVDAVTDALRYFGFGFLQAQYMENETYLDQLVGGLHLLVQEKSPCQRFADGEVDEKTAADHDEVLIDNVTDLIGVLAQTIGPAFAPHFGSMFQDLMKFNQPHRPASDRSMAIGCVAEVGAELGDSFVRYIPEMFPLVLKGLEDEAVSVRRNSAYCAGVMFECSGNSGAAVPFLEASLNALQRLFTVGDNPSQELLGCKDNAVSAVAKMIMATADKLPLPQVVPLLLSGCPLVCDFSECKYVYKCILGLFQNAQLMMPHLDQVVAIFSRVVGDNSVDEEVRGWVRNFGTQLLQQQPEQTKAALSKLNPELANMFMAQCAQA